MQLPLTGRREFVARLAGATVGALCAGLPAAVENRWPDERAAGPWLFHADYSLEELRPLVDELAQLQDDLINDLQIEATRESIHVFLFRQKSTYQSYMRHFFPNVISRRAMYIKRRGPGMVFAQHSEELPIDLRHECTHALLHGALPLVPLWLDEGLAEYYEPGQANRSRNHPYQNTIIWRTRLGQVRSLKSLEQLNELAEMGKAEYRDSWAWVHFMLHGPQAGRTELRRYLADIANSSPPGDLSARLERRIDRLPRAFADHFHSWS
ncbi:MAG: hypothetical protein FJ295_07225 [Planctomycetes bacterium]|nr:hypothetical protein [Planctomycetota bacterium]